MSDIEYADVLVKTRELADILKNSNVKEVSELAKGTLVILEKAENNEFFGHYTTECE